MNPRSFEFLRLTALFFNEIDNDKKAILLKEANQALSLCSKEDKEELNNWIIQNTSFKED